MPTVTLKDVTAGLPQKLTVKGPPRRGGEAEVHFTTDGQYAIKVYHEPNEQREQLLTLVRTLFGSLTPAEEAFILPPLALVDKVDGAERVGFVMRRVDPSYRELGDFMLSPKAFAAQAQQQRKWADYLKVARCLASCIAVLHGKGCAHSDIHYRNFMIDLATGQAVMLEMDGVVVPGFLPPQVAGMPGYMAPEILTQRGTRPSERTDRHSLAVLLLHTLLFRNVMNPLIDYDTDPERSDALGWGERAVFSEHPTDRRHRPRAVGQPLFQRGALSCEILGPRLAGLARRALIDGLHDPDARPSSREWLSTLATATDEVYQCDQGCRQWLIYPHWQAPRARRACPFCGKRLGGLPPVVLDLFERRASNEYQPTGRRLVLGAGFSLFEDVVDPHRIPPVTRQSEPKIGRCEWDQTTSAYRLVNLTDQEWTSRSPVTGARLSAVRGESIALHSGTAISLGMHRRMLRVAETP